jgi:flagellar protein FlaG
MNPVGGMELMSVNFPVSGGRSVECVVAHDVAPKAKADAGNRVSENGVGVPLSINNMSDLKNAEMRGEKYTISDEQLVKAIEKAIHAMQGKTTSLEFSIHEQTKLISVRVKDSQTGEVIREVPPEKTLDFVAKLWEMAGLFIDEKR